MIHPGVCSFGESSVELCQDDAGDESDKRTRLHPSVVLTVQTTSSKGPYKNVDFLRVASFFKCGLRWSPLASPFSLDILIKLYI